MLAKFLLAGLQVIEEFSSTDRPRDASPSCPEILHPAQSTTVQQNSGLGYCPTVVSQIHLDGEIEVLRAEGPVGVMELAQGYLRQELWGPQSDTVMIMRVPMAQPLEAVLTLTSRSPLNTN